MLAASPLHRLLGLELDACDAAAGTVTIGLPLRPEISRSDERIELHGGVTATLVDVAGVCAVALAVGHPVTTIDLRVDYLRMGYGERISATARAVRLGRSIGRRVGGAVVRGRAKRLIREAFRLSGPARIAPDTGGYDLVVSTRAHTGYADRSLKAPEVMAWLVDAARACHRERQKRDARTPDRDTSDV